MSRQLLLGLARLAVKAAAHRLKLPAPPVDTPAELRMASNQGAFVTLTKAKRLRGCIGLLQSRLPLVDTIIEMAAAAAAQDPRFSPVVPSEVDELRIEISVLSPLQRVHSAQEIVLGRDGVLVEYDGHSGVFLPQVAMETGWDLERFLSELCSNKAGLPADAWKRSETNLSTFTAEIFHE